MSSDAQAVLDAPTDASNPPAVGTKLPAVAAGALTALFGFLLASFPARNSDVWLQLAAGKSLLFERRLVTAGGQLELPTAVDQDWLYNLAAYGVYSLLGGTGLVLLKAIFAGGLAWAIWRTSRLEGGVWIPALSAALAILAISPRLLVQPATLSLAFLLMTLWQLRRHMDRRDLESADAALQSWLPPWSWVGTFVLWANVDRSFWLGILVTALALIGFAVDLTMRKGWQASNLPSRFFRVFVWLAVLTAAGMLNPVRLYGLTRNFEWADVGLISVPFAGGTRLASSPLESAYFESIGRTPAGAAYFVLLAAGAAAFSFRRTQWPWRWFVPWLGLAALSAWESRAIPFFAVVAGPLLAWTLHESLTRKVVEQRWNYSPLVAVAVIWLIGLNVLAWPGLLQAPPYEPRQWRVDTAPSLERGAGTVRGWLKEGKLNPATRALHVSPESAAAFAWFCPELKTVFDATHAASLRLDRNEKPNELSERLEAAGIDCIVVYEADRNRLFAILSMLLSDPVQFPLLALEGDLAIFGRRRGEGRPSADSLDSLKLDVHRRAFRPEPSDLAPEQRPQRDALSGRWWHVFVRRAPPRPIDRDAAALYLLHAESLRRTAPLQHQAVWESGQLAATVGFSSGWPLGGPGIGCGEAWLRLAIFQPPLPPPDEPAAPATPLTVQILGWHQWFTHQQDDSPPALLYLAIRAARRAIAVNPDDAHAYLILGESYLRLLHNTRERSWTARLPELIDLAALRRIQAATALQQAAALRPDMTQAHFNLGALHMEMGFLDLALQHQRRYLELVRNAGPPPGVDESRFRDTTVQSEREFERLVQTVADRERQFSRESAGKRVLDRAELAMQKGLAGKALEILLKSDFAAFGAQGLSLELDLLLRTGRVKQARDWIDPSHREALGVGIYHWVRTQLWAASGDYALAIAECEELVRAIGLRDESSPGLSGRRAAALIVAEAILDEAPEGKCLATLLWQASRRSELHERLMRLSVSLRREADVTVLLGLLALEQGDVNAAAAAFRQALVLHGEDGTGLDFYSRPAAQAGLGWLRAATTAGHSSDTR